MCPTTESHHKLHDETSSTSGAQQSSHTEIVNNDEQNGRNPHRKFTKKVKTDSGYNLKCISKTKKYWTIFLQTNMKNL